MNIAKNDELAGASGRSSSAPYAGLGEIKDAVSEMCGRLPVSSGATGLAKELARVMPQHFFRPVLSRGGWYRLGGVIDKSGNHLADDLGAWAEAELAARDDDMQALFDDFSGRKLRASRLVGKTHYLVASIGHNATDFIQIEIEELQEVVGHLLFTGVLPGNLEELIDAPRVNVDKQAGKPLGEPFYSLRRVTDVADFLRRMGEQKPEPQSVHRFFDAWQRCSAGFATQFSNHWVVAVREHLDRFKQPILQATPVVTTSGLPLRFDAAPGVAGLALYEALQRFDRKAGYPMAWFFHMLTTKAVPQAVAYSVVDDVQAGFSYLPARDVTVIKDWIHRPFAF